MAGSVQLCEAPRPREAGGCMEGVRHDGYKCVRLVHSSYKPATQLRRKPWISEARDKKNLKGSRRREGTNIVSERRSYRRDQLGKETTPMPIAHNRGKESRDRNKLNENVGKCTSVIFKVLAWV